MMFGNKVGLRDTYVTANNVIETYADQEPVLTNGPDINFWADVKDDKSGSIYVDGVRVNRRMIELICDSRDVSALSNGTKLRIDNDNRTYQVDDVYDHEFRFTSMVVAYEHND